MPGFIRKVLSSFTLYNFKRLMRFLFRDPPRPRLKDLAIFLKLMFIDVSELTDEELERIGAIKLKIRSALKKMTSLLDGVEKELAFRKRRRELASLSNQEIRLRLDALIISQVEDLLRAPIRDAVDKALLTEECLRNGKYISMEEYVLRRIFKERIQTS